ncbi:MAG: thioredoxin domain-containing protein [Cyanobacteriota bacterium SKYGB_h_bin112]|nr:thioredoxin domain-containing protein [Cyanobacteriota bacterium SKYGB_h_bin112]
MIASGLLLVGLALTSCTAKTTASSSDPELEAKVLEIIRKNPQVILDAVQAYRQEQEANRRKAQQEFLDNMLNNPKAVIDRSPTMGSTDQSIVLVMFSDFQCPYCAEAHKEIKAFMEKHRDQVTFAYKHLPLVSIHPEALPAAKAAWAAMQQGKFWEYQDALFTNQDKLGDQQYIAIAKSLGLDVDKFNRDRASDDAAKAIQTDVELAESLGINGTPFLIMNGEVVEAGPELPTQLEATLAKVKQAKTKK